MIVYNGRNRDTSLYVVLNSEWAEIELKLKKIVGVDIFKKQPKAYKHHYF
jgi:hypothetical protein